MRCSHLVWELEKKERRIIFSFWFLIIFVFLNFLSANIDKADAGICLTTNDDGTKACADINSYDECSKTKGSAMLGDWTCEKYNATNKMNLKGLGALGESVEKLGKGLGGKTKPLEEVLGGYIKTALVLVGTLFMALTFYGGYIWFIARDDEEEAKRAKSIISMALIGLIIVLAAYFVTYFIIYRLTVASGTGLLK